MTQSPGADPGSPLQPLDLDPSSAPDADPAAVPDGFVVIEATGVRIHFHDWRGPAAAGAVLLLPGLAQPAWSWAPVARRLAAVRRTVVADLRGQGLSDSPAEGYDIDRLAADAVAAAEGAGLLDPVVVAGHGFGAIVAAAAASRLGDRCAGLVLVDGGWERLEVTTGIDLDEFLRGLDEPPEVLRSMEAYLGDRRGYDPGSWDADQERAARDAVVETAAGHVVRAVRPFVVESLVRTMFDYDPAAVLPAVAAPVTALVALGSGDADARLAELRRTADARVATGRSPIRVTGFARDAHNLMRYRPAEVTAAIIAADGRPGAGTGAGAG